MYQLMSSEEQRRVLNGKEHPAYLRTITSSKLFDYGRAALVGAAVLVIPEFLIGHLIPFTDVWLATVVGAGAGALSWFSTTREKVRWRGGKLSR